MKTIKQSVKTVKKYKIELKRHKIRPYIIYPTVEQIETMGNKIFEKIISENFPEIVNINLLIQEDQNNLARIFFKKEKKSTFGHIIVKLLHSKGKKPKMEISL